MKAATTTINLAMGMGIIFLLAIFLAFAPRQAQAQESSIQEPSYTYSKEELAQMLAPIALYPDALLSQVLMASTYPIEVIEADRWVRRNSELKDEALDDALLDQDWDPSVKAVCHFPAVLAVMSDKITQTTIIGNAFLAQEGEVMDMIQELRTKAKAQGNLSTNTEQKVIVEKETIIIEPANPRVVYVPYYDPYYIYGPWWYPAYPPYYWGPPGVSIGIGISYWPGFYFGFAWGTWSYFDWHQRNIYIDVRYRPRYVRHDRWRATPGYWDHAPVHRRGVAYRDKPTARKYGQYPARTREFRPDTRGFPDRSSQDRGRVRSLDDRTGIKQDTRRNDRTQIERTKQDRARSETGQQESQRVESQRQVQPRAGQEVRKQERVESSRQERVTPEPVSRDRSRVESPRQEQPRIETGRQESQRVESQRQVQPRAGQEVRKQERVESSRQERVTPEPVSRDRSRVESPRQEQPRIETRRQESQRVESQRQVQPRAGQEVRTQERVDARPQQRSGDNVFSRVDDGRSERQSSERGRSSRQGLGNDASRSMDRSGSDSRGSRGSQGGKRR